MPLVRPVVLCGGAGSRLWPASRPDRPKPLLALVEDRSMLAATVARFSAPGFLAPWVVCGAAHAEAVAAELPGVRRLVEDRPRGTAAAVVLGATHAEPTALLLFVPADHVVHDEAALRDAVLAAAPVAADGWIVTFGIVPTAPATGYGWIAPGEAIAHGARRVDAFVEKPDPARAAAFLAAGTHVWNSGMFLCRASAMLDEVDRLAPDLRGPDGTGSLDVRILERTARAAVLPVACGWSDVGTWASVAEARADRPAGPVTIDGSPGTFVWSDGPHVAVLDAPGLVVIASGGSVLVATPVAVDRCRTLALPARQILEQGPGWAVERIRLAAGEVVVLDAPGTVVAGEVGGARPGETLAPGTRVATCPSVVLAIRISPAGGSASG